MKTQEIFIAHDVLARTGIAKLKGEAKLKVLLIIQGLEKVTEEYTDLLRKAQDKLKPRGFDKDVLEPMQSLQGKKPGELTEDEKAVKAKYDAFNAEVGKVMQPEWEKDRDLSKLPKFDEKEFSALIGAETFDSVGLVKLFRDNFSTLKK